MLPEIQEYNNKQSEEYKIICNKLALLITENLPEAENKIWHGHPVWFFDGNPIVGYNKLKRRIDNRREYKHHHHDPVIPAIQQCFFPVLSSQFSPSQCCTMLKHRT